MKIAVCFSGMIRTGFHASNSLRAFLGQHLGCCEFFLHTWREQCHRPPRRDIEHPLTRDFVYAPLNHDDIKFITEAFEFRSVKIDDRQSLDLQGMQIGPLWLSWYESIKLKQQYESHLDMRFDYVLKLRPDIIFRPGVTLDSILDQAQENVFCFNDYFPLALDDGTTIQSVDDVFFLSRSDVMDQAVNFVHECAYQIEPHNNFYDYLEKTGLQCRKLGFSYWHEVCHSILRTECLHYDPVTDFEKCYECNLRVHYPYNVTTNYMSEHEVQELYEKVGYPILTK